MGRIPSLIQAPDKSGTILGINRKVIAEMPYFLLTNEPNNSVVVPANQSSILNVMTVSGEGPASIVSLAHEKTAAMRVMMMVQDGRTQYGLMNGACHIDTVMGSGAQPYRLSEALYIDERRSVQVAFTDISGAANAVRVCAFASRMLTQQIDTTLTRIRKRMAEQQYLSMPYWYTLDNGPITVGAGLTVQETITVGQDHHFQAFKFSAVNTGLFSVDIIDSQKGESFITAPGGSHYPISSDLLFGNGNFPFVFHEPRLVQVGQRLLVNITDLSGAPNTIHLTLGGRALKVRMWR